MKSAAVDFVMPVYNEGENIEAALSELYANVVVEKRVLVVYDRDDDTTLPVIRRIVPSYPGLQLVRNRKGPGVLNALRAGIEACGAEVVIVTMADLSDDIAAANRMVELIATDQADVVCASRYMPGGRQIGGPWLKGRLSWLAGLSLHQLTGIPTHDATNAFRAYRRSIIQAIPIESRGGFEVSLELTVKAFAEGHRVVEIPCTWRDRSAGASRFRLLRWLPHYLHWYFWALMHRPGAGAPRG